MFRSRSSRQQESSLSSGKASIISTKLESPPQPSENTIPLGLDHSESKSPTPDTEDEVSVPKQEDNTITIESMSAVIAAAVQMSATSNMGGAPSSLSMGHASIVPSTTATATTKTNKAKRRLSSRLFSAGWKKQEEPAVVPEEEETSSRTSGSSQSSSTGGNVSPRTSSGSASSSYGSARFTWLTGKPIAATTTTGNGTMTAENPPQQKAPGLDDGRDELLYRGIHVKEIKSTLKTMVIPDNVRNPMPEVKLERPGFARINY
ncbi:hypothetical protein EC973_000376 [Apophysomyces ossiformis]|uniref:Uncharacterized protein n=1 Tax=Apophysomyces ossiformis TaxID=679940 RepID=A0A8H7BLD4_9FUNG|nr:hypothetical protein EC973_000376 [Apophysomyces ossiformis]